MIRLILLCSVCLATPPVPPAAPNAGPPPVAQLDASEPVRALPEIKWARLDDESAAHAGTEFVRLAFQLEGEDPVREVLVACREVSVAEVRAFLDATSYHRTEAGDGVMSLDFRPPEREDHPAGYLSAVDALHFIDWRNKQHPAAPPVRLPTIVERLALSKAVVDAPDFEVENRNRVLDVNLDGYADVGRDDTHAFVKHVFSNVNEITSSRPAAELLASVEFEPVDEPTLRQLVIIYSYRDGEPHSLWFTREDGRFQKTGIRLVTDVPAESPAPEPAE